MENRSRGFTVIELMVTLSIAAIILSIGAPSFIEFRRSNRLTGIANDFLGAVLTARTEAIKRQLQVSVCPSDNPNDADAKCIKDGGPFNGWIAFLDPNGDCERTGANVPSPLGGPATLETDAVNLVRAGGPIDTQVNARSRGTCVSFAPTGFLQAVPGRVTARRTMFCDSRGTALQEGSTTLSAAREIQVTNVGRSRITRVLAELGADPALGAALACP